MSSPLDKIELNDTSFNNSLVEYDTSVIPTLDYETLNYDYFFRNFMCKNIPCIIKNVSGLWKCSTDWILENTINYHYFINEYDNLMAPVADCSSINHNSQCKKSMKVSEYMTYLKNYDKKQLLYLKDWHLKQARPEDNFYITPHIFASDWLNEWAEDHKEDDFMFVYIGPEMSWTPIHVDVYNSFSWSVNVIGRKKWIFFPPGEEDKIKDSLGNLPLLYDDKIFKNVLYHEIIQERGDAIFVPSGWHHQVENLLDTISINHNWINGCNLHVVWKALQDSLKSVEHEIKEYSNTSEYVPQCQLILKSLFGMNFENFIKFLCYIAEKRLSQLDGKHCLIFQKYLLGCNHVLFDLKVILCVMNEIENDKSFFEIFLLTHLEPNFILVKKAITDKICTIAPC